MLNAIGISFIDGLITIWDVGVSKDTLQNKTQLIKNKAFMKK